MNRSFSLAWTLCIARNFTLLSLCIITITFTFAKSYIVIKYLTALSDFSKFSVTVIDFFGLMILI